jgi:type IV secretory pathway VirB10-like protein
MPEDHYPSLPGPDSDEPQEERSEEQERHGKNNATPDYRRFVGSPWYKRRWVQSYLWPAGVIVFAAVVLVTRTASVVKTAFQSSNGKETSVGELRRDVRSSMRAQSSPLRSAPVPETQTDIDNATNTERSGNDYGQQIAEEKRRHRMEAFAAPIFAETAPTGKLAQPIPQPSPVPDLSGADLSGLSPEQKAQLKRYLQTQQVLEGDQVSPPAQPTTQGVMPGGTRSSATAIAPTASPNEQEAQKQKNLELNQASGPLHKIFPGTVVEAALDTALESSLTGVVLAHFTRDVHTNNLLGPILIPAGTQLVGEAAPVTTLNQPRLKVTFDLAIEPNGYCLNLDQFQAMNQQGETGLADSVSNHWMRTIGIAAVVGVIEGLSQFGNAGVSIYSPRTEIYNGVGSEAGREGIRILDRFLNVPPTVKVNPGSRIRIVFPVGLNGIPEYQNTQMAANL